MELKIYNWEKFERDKLRYTIFSSIFIIIFILSVFYKNIVWIILMFFILWAYIYYGIINIQETEIKISENGLLIWSRIIPRTNLMWYCIELDQKKQEIKNVVFVSLKWHNIYTIIDDEQNIREFLENLNQKLPMLADFSQTFREKVSRKMKL